VRSAPGSPVTRLAVVGLENLHAAGWLQTMRSFEDIAVVGAYRNRPQASLPTLGDLYGDVPVFDDLSYLLDRVEFDAVLVLLNGRDAPPAMLALAEAGKHMLVEKPAARSPQELAPVEAAVRHAGLVFYPGFTTRAKQAARDMRRLIREGALGDVLTIQASYFASLVEKRGPEQEIFQRDRFGGGILPWLGIHYLDLMRFVSGLEPQWVSGGAGNVAGQPVDVEDVAVLVLGLGGGLASLHTGYVMTEEPKHLLFSVYGTRGWLRWPGGGDDLQVWSESDPWFQSPGRTVTYSTPAAPGYGGRDGQYFVRSFLRAMRGEEAPLLDIGDLMATLQIIQAAYLAAQEGTRVTIEGAGSDV